MVFEGHSLEEDIKHALGIFIAVVGEEGDFREHDNNFWGEVEVALSGVLSDEQVCLVHAVFALFEEGFILLGILYEKRCIFEQLTQFELRCTHLNIIIFYGSSHSLSQYKL